VKRVNRVAGRRRRRNGPAWVSSVVKWVLAKKDFLKEELFCFKHRAGKGKQGREEWVRGGSHRRRDLRGALGRVGLDWCGEKTEKGGGGRRCGKLVSSEERCRKVDSPKKNGRRERSIKVLKIPNRLASQEGKRRSVKKPNPSRHSKKIKKKR